MLDKTHFCTRRTWVADNKCTLTQGSRVQACTPLLGVSQKEYLDQPVK